MIDPGFVISVDRREQCPWSFLGIEADAKAGHAAFDVRTEAATLDAGDYGIVGDGRRIAIERKSGPDLFQTLCGGRARFERELDRLAGLEFSAVIVESEFAALVRDPPTFMSTRSFVGSVAALQLRYPTAWWFLPSRRWAEVMAFRLLHRWHKDHALPRAEPTEAVVETMEAATA